MYDEDDKEFLKKKKVSERGGKGCMPHSAGREFQPGTSWASSLALRATAVFLPTVRARRRRLR